MLSEEQEREFVELVLGHGARTAMAVNIGDRTPRQYDKADEIADGIKRGVGYALRAMGLRPPGDLSEYVTRAEGELMVTVHLRPSGGDVPRPEDQDGEWNAAATGTTHQFESASEIAANDNPYEAAWNALAGVMTALGFDK